LRTDRERNGPFELLHCRYRVGRHGLDVHVLRDSDVAVAKDRLNRLVIHSQPMKIRRKAAPECAPHQANFWRFWGGSPMALSLDDSQGGDVLIGVKLVVALDI